MSPRPLRRLGSAAALASLIILTATPAGATSTAASVARAGHPACPKPVAKQVSQIPPHEAMLTFDDGPNPRYTPLLLDILAKYHVKATFFLVGQNAARYPALVRRIKAAGHVVANHSWDHADFRHLSAARLSYEIDHTNAVLAKITGSTPCFFRFPYGDANTGTLRAVNARGMTPYYWTVDTRDWAGGSTQAIVATVWRELSSRHGAIVLQHDIQGPRSINAVPAIIAGLRARHYKFVTAALGKPMP